MYNFKGYIGEVVKDHNEIIIGTLKSVEDEAADIWGNVNNDFEVSLNGAEYVL